MTLFFFSETDFIPVILQRSGHSAECVKISYKSNHQRSAINALCQDINIFDQCFVSHEHSRNTVTLF